MWRTGLLEPFRPPTSLGGGGRRENGDGLRHLFGRGGADGENNGGGLRHFSGGDGTVTHIAVAILPEVFRRSVVHRFYSVGAA